MTNSRGGHFFVIFQLRACYQLFFFCGGEQLYWIFIIMCAVFAPDVLKKCSQQQRTMVSEALEGGMLQW